MGETEGRGCGKRDGGGPVAEQVRRVDGVRDWSSSSRMPGWVLH